MHVARDEGIVSVSMPLSPEVLELLADRDPKIWGAYIRLIERMIDAFHDEYDEYDTEYDA